MLLKINILLLQTILFSQLDKIKNIFIFNPIINPFSFLLKDKLIFKTKIQMKKFLIVALLAASLTGFAQSTTKKNSAEKAMDKMTSELTLTAEQQGQLKPFFEEQMALKEDTKLNSDHEEANKLKSKEINTKVYKFLTQEQNTLRKQLREKEKAAKAPEVQPATN